MNEIHILTLRYMMIEFNTYLYLQPALSKFLYSVTLPVKQLEKWNWKFYVYNQYDCVLKHTNMFENYTLTDNNETYYLI